MQITRHVLHATRLGLLSAILFFFCDVQAHTHRHASLTLPIIARETDASTAACFTPVSMKQHRSTVAAVADSRIADLPKPAASMHVHAMTPEIEQADELFDRQEYDAARRLLETLLRSRPNDAEVLWRLSNYAINDGDAARYATPENPAAKQYYQNAVRYAERAVQADPGNAYAHAFLAASFGSYAMYAGGKEKVKLANRIRDELDIALELDPRNQVAHTIYGTWHREVAEVSWVERQLANVFLGGMPDGSIERSIYHLNAAIKIAPKVLRHHYELGKTYIAAEKKKEAAQAFRRALQCRDSWNIDPWRRARMKEWLRRNT